MNISEIAKLNGMTLSSASRIILNMTEGKIRIHGKAREGQGLLRMVPDPRDGRALCTVLTPQGNRVKRSLAAIVED